MESLYLLIPIALVLVILAIGIFFWAVKSGQFEDLDTEGKRILFDNDRAGKKKNQHDGNQQDRNKNSH